MYFIEYVLNAILKVQTGDFNMDIISQNIIAKNQRRWAETANIPKYIKTRNIVTQIIDNDKEMHDIVEKFPYVAWQSLFIKYQFCVGRLLHVLCVVLCWLSQIFQ